MSFVVRFLRWLGIALGLVIAVLLGGFGVLQTQAGQTWLARTIDQTISTPDFTVAIAGLHGTVPFNIKVDRIDIGDRDGIYLTARGFGLDISPAALLSGLLHIRSLSFADVDMARSSTAPSTTPWTEYLKVPRVPIGVVLDRLSIDRLALAPPVLGESLVAAVQGSARLAGETAHLALELHRTDGAAGNILLAMELAGATPILQLQLEASEPTGMLLDRVLGRNDRAPLAVSLKGTGPLADWHGRVTASAGTLAKFNADLMLAVASQTSFGVTGTAALAPLLPPDFAPIIGDQLTLSLHGSSGERMVFDALSIEIAAGRLTGDAAFGGDEKAIAAHLRANVPNLSAIAGLLGDQLSGSASLVAEVTGTESRPAVTLTLSGSGVRVGGSGADHVEAQVSATPTGVLDNPDARIEFAASGRVEGLVAPEGVAVPAELGRNVDWSLAGDAARDGSAVDLTRLSAEGAGLALTGAGQLAGGGQTIEGNLRLSIADLRPFSGFVGHTLTGSVELAADATREGTSGFKARFQGSASKLRTGIAAADALVGDNVSLTGSLQRDSAGALVLDKLAVAGAGASLSGDGRFDPASSQLAAALSVELPRLKLIGPALGMDVAGALSARINAEGALDHLRLDSEVTGDDIAAGGRRVDRLRLVGKVADLAEPKAVLDGAYRAYGLDGTLALTGELNGNSELLLPRLRLTAADSAIEGSLRVALDTYLVQGSINGRAPDLARFSKLAGTPLGGSIEFRAGLDARGGQSVDLSLTGRQLTAGQGSSRSGIGRVELSAKLADVMRAPSGTGRLSLTAAKLGASEFATATLALDAPRPGRFTFQGDAKGQPLTLALAGDGGLEPGRLELRLTRLAGSLGPDRIVLEQPLTLSKRGADLGFSGLALDFGTGRITGNGGVRGESLSLALNVADFPIASGARLMGYRNVRGTLAIAANLGGTLRAPRGRFSVNARQISLSSAKNSQLPELGVAIDSNWNGRSLDLRGQVNGLKGDQIGFSGALPLLLNPAPLGISVPTDGRLAFQLQGSGQVEHLADLLPLGEDRVSGHFAANVAVGGTLAAPAASGRLQLTDGRYENFATGAVLTKMQADLVGDRDRFTLSSLSASDTASGTLKVRGNVALQGPAGPTAELSATLDNFRVAARDEAVATASGNISIAGPLSSPKITAPLTINRADINLPSSLPPNVVVLKVVERNGKKGKPAAPAAVENQPPALPATLDIKIDMPGNIFVRGHGLESEWRGKLAITGTSAAPAISGSLEQVHGTLDLLGKTFTITRGEIRFDGSAKLDPVLDIVAETSTSDITAQVNLSGVASAPKVTLSSTPPVPQDEILARVLFNKGVGQMSAGEGMQLAAAASTLAGGGQGMLDKLRGSLGLDFFRLGSSTSSPTTGTLNQRAAASSSGTGGTALSAGKYIAPGVSVGVSQGVSPPTSKVTVQIEVRPHLTIGGEAGQSGSTGLGLNYNYDY
ncbi:MAG: translocation/assembly module TamB domain-containing protein [Alphaproteobacteria bacterium]|nr:translocation/assembly module TamB domain-containing protein [Alphaproteobacteria bacterium]